MGQRRSAAKLPAAKLGPIYADGRLIADPAEKSALYQQTGAMAADMESHLVAGAAARLGVPFAVLRCISDEADSALPPAIAVAMKPDGGLALGAIIKSILRKPLQMPDLLTALAGFNRASRLCNQESRAVGPRLAYRPDHDQAARVARR